MSKITIAITIAAALLATGLLSFAFKDSLTKREIPFAVREAYVRWSSKFGKLRSSPQESEFRIELFEKTFNFVQNHNSDTSKSFQVSLNQFSDLTDEEFMNYQGIRKPQEVTGRGMPDKEVIEPLKSTQLGQQQTESVDMRNWLQTTSITHGSNCNDNYAWIAAVNMNANYYISHKKPIEYAFSPQTYIDCTDFGCDGGQSYDCFLYSEKNGIDSLNSYPYIGNQKGCRATIGLFKNKKSTLSEPVKGSLIKEYLMKKQGVMTVGMDLSSYEARTYREGVFDGPCSYSPTQNLLLIGLDSTDPDEDKNKGAQKYWWVMNTWGDSWGEAGFMKVKRFDVDDDYSMSSCGLTVWASYPEFN